MEFVSCNYCGAEESTLVDHGPDFLLDRPGDFRLVRCRQCGLIYQNPKLSQEELMGYYPDDYEPYSKDLVGEESLFKRVDLQHHVSRRCTRVLNHQQGPGRLLDVGCSTGLFLHAMQERGWEVAGIEPSPYASGYAREKLGLEVVTGTLEDTDYADNSFEIVTMWDVLEHVPDPKATMAEVARILKPGGLFVASLPNPAAFESRIFGRYWIGWDRPRHLHLFSPAVVRGYLEEAGLQLESIESFSGRLGLTLFSVGFWLKARGIPEERWRPWLDAIYNIPLRVLSWPIYWLTEALNRSTIMTVFARKPQ